MRVFVITPNGDRVSAEQLCGHLVAMLCDGDEGALRVMAHICDSNDAADNAELATLADAMRAEPARARELCNQATDEALTRLAFAAAIAYQQRTPGASLDMAPENDADAEFLSKRGLLRQ